MEVYILSTYFFTLSLGHSITKIPKLWLILRDRRIILSYVPSDKCLVIIRRCRRPSLKNECATEDLALWLYHRRPQCTQGLACVVSNSII